MKNNSSNFFERKRRFILMKVREIIFQVEEDTEGGYTAKAPGCSIFTKGETLGGSQGKYKDALKCHFEKNEDMPTVICLHIVKAEMFLYAWNTKGYFWQGIGKTAWKV